MTQVSSGNACGLPPAATCAALILSNERVSLRTRHIFPILGALLILVAASGKASAAGYTLPRGGRCPGGWPHAAEEAWRRAGAVSRVLGDIEDEKSLVVRCHETEGRPGRARVTLPDGKSHRMWVCDLHERQGNEITADDGYAYHAYEIVTLRIDP